MHGQRVLTHFPHFHVIFLLEFTCSQWYIFITKHRLTKVSPWSKFLVEVDVYKCLTSNTQHCAWGKGNWSSPFVGVAKSQATAARERRCDCLEDMDNLVYDISFFLFLFFFSLNTCSPKVLFSESLQRNLLNVEIEIWKKKSFFSNK